MPQYFHSKMKLILITTPHYFVEEDQIITNLFDEGLDVLHLRKPDTPAVYAERLLTLIPEKYRKRIVVHDHFYLKNEYKLKGIHLSSRNPIVPDNYSGHISASCHTLEEVEADKKNCDYVFLSPIFDSISKPGYCSAFTPEIIREASRKGIIDKKVMALGGVDDSNILRVKDFGFGGAAVMGCLWNKFNPSTYNNYQALIAYFRKLRDLAD